MRTFERTRTGEDCIACLKSLPWAPAPRVIVLDNASRHTSTAVEAQRPALARWGIYLYDLPACSPEWNESESIFR